MIYMYIFESKYDINIAIKNVIVFMYRLAIAINLNMFNKGILFFNETNDNNIKYGNE